MNLSKVAAPAIRRLADAIELGNVIVHPNTHVGYVPYVEPTLAKFWERFYAFGEVIEPKMWEDAYEELERRKARLRNGRELRAKKKARFAALRALDKALKLR